MAKFKHLLVTTDFSDRAHTGVETARELAADLGAKLSLLFVLEQILPSLAFGGQVARVESQHQQTAEAQEHLKDYVAKTFPQGGVTAHFRIGSPFREILDCCSEIGADLIVMSSQGRGSVSQLIFGSTTTRVLQLSSCPVLVVREPAEK